MKQLINGFIFRIIPDFYKDKTIFFVILVQTVNVI